jgi:hypothetical protein
MSIHQEIKNNKNDIVLERTGLNIQYPPMV